MASQLILNQLPESVQTLYNTYYAPYQSYLHPFISRTFLLGQSVFFNYVYPTAWALYSVINRISGGDTSDITLFSLFFTVIAALFGFWVLNAVRRQVVSFVYNILAILFWGVIITLGVFTYYRGFDQTIGDISDLVNMFSDSQQKGQRRGAGKARQKQWEAGRTRKW